MDVSDITGEIEGIVFWPHEAVSEAFEKVENEAGSRGELERLRLFYRTMKFFYDISATADIKVPPGKVNALYKYAKKGLEAEEKAKTKGEKTT